MGCKEILKAKFFAGLLICFLCVAGVKPLQAQEAQRVQEQVVLRLKNGSVLKGTLLGEEEGHYELRIGSGTLVKVPKGDVQKLEVDSPKYKKGYVLVQMGLYFGSRQQDNQDVLVAPSILATVGYQWRHWLQFGGGMGFEQYGKVTVLPVFAEIGGRVLDKTVSPYYTFRLGSGIADVEDDMRYQEAKAKLLLGGQAGISIQMKDFSWQLGAGFHQQKVRLEGSSMLWDGREDTRWQDRSLRRLVAATSFRFSF